MTEDEDDDDQSWFWTEEWQAGERQAQKEIDGGLLTTYGTFEEFLAALQAGTLNQ